MISKILCNICLFVCSAVVASFIIYLLIVKTELMLLLIIFFMIICCYTYIYKICCDEPIPQNIHVNPVIVIHSPLPQRMPTMYSRSPVLIMNPGRHYVIGYPQYSQ